MKTEADSPLFGRTTLALAIGVGALSLGLGTYFGLAERSRGSVVEAAGPVKHRAPSEASIFFPTTDVSFGDMRPGEKKEILVAFRNEGASPLTLRKARSSCACVFATLMDNELKGGQEGHLKVLLIAEAKHGRIEYPVYVESNDPRQPFVKLKAIVTVDSGISPEPDVLDLGTVRPGSQFRGFVKLTLRDGCMEAGGVGSSAPEIKAELVHDKDKGLGIAVEGVAPTKTGPFAEKVGLTAKGSTSPILYIPIKGCITP